MTDKPQSDTYTIDPMAGAPPYMFGMTDADVQKTAGEKALPNPAWPQLRTYVNAGVRTWSVDGKVAMYEFQPPAVVKFNGLTPIGQQWVAALRALRGVDDKMTYDNDSALAPTYNVKYWQSTGRVLTVSCWQKGFNPDTGKFDAQPAPTKAATDAPVVTGADAFDYWKDYDGLLTDLGTAWLSDYMSRVQLSFTNDQPPTDAEVQAALDAQHSTFMNAMLGAQGADGPLVRLIMAGMAAGHAAITQHRAANPQHVLATKDVGINVDWTLLATEARNFAKQYFYTLIRNVDDTTRMAVQKAVTAWISSGAPLSELRDALAKIFQDEARAALIAQTESTRAYAEGTLERYRRAEVQRVTWNTVKMPVGDAPGDVCPLCDELEKLGPTPISQMPVPPRHPGCRCWLRPVVINEAMPV